ncbi:transposase [Saccharothrix syringae]
MLPQADFAKVRGHGPLGSQADGFERERRRRVRRRGRARLTAPLLGRSRGGLTGKVHLACDPCSCPLVFVLTEGQAADSPRFVPVLDGMSGCGPVGRARTRPDAVAGDKAYSSCASRAHLRRCGIKGVIPVKADRSPTGGRRAAGADGPISTTPCSTQDITRSNGASTRSRHGEGSPSATTRSRRATSPACTYAGP